MTSLLKFGCKICFLTLGTDCENVVESFFRDNGKLLPVKIII